MLYLIVIHNYAKVEGQLSPIRIKIKDKKAQNGVIITTEMPLEHHNFNKKWGKKV